MQQKTDTRKGWQIIVHTHMHMHADMHELGT